MPARSGVEVARAYSAAVVEPLVARAVPGVPFAVARLGSGSDVLGFDDDVSTDHDWGLRLTVTVPEHAVEGVAEALDRGLPDTFQGLPVRFPTTWDPRVRPGVEVHTVRALGLVTTGIDLGRPLALLDRLSLTGQAALELTAGAVFRDDDGALTAARRALAEPPEDVRRWAVASCWTRLADELPFVGRAAERGDAAGSRVLVARLTQTAMRLGFLLERRWSPYSKWLGTAFRALPAAGAAAPAIADALAAPGWREAEAALASALDALAALQAGAGLPARVPATGPFWSRRYRGCHDIAGDVLATIDDPTLAALPPVGPPDLWSDDVRVLTDHALRRGMTAAIIGGA